MDEMTKLFLVVLVFVPTMIIFKKIFDQHDIKPSENKKNEETEKGEF